MTEPAAPDGTPGPGRDGTSDGPPGARTFSLEGRAAPGLYFVAWLATLVGGGTLLVALLAGGTGVALGLALLGSLLLAVGLIAGAGSQSLERRHRLVGASAGPASGAESAAGDAGSAAGSGYRGPSPFLVFAATLPLTILGAAVILVPLVWAGVPSRSPLATLLSVVLTAAVYLALVRLVVVGTGALSWAEMGLRRIDATALRELVSGAVLALPVALVTVLLGALLTRVVGTSPISPLPAAGSTLGLLANLTAAAIVAPLGEEVFFRGYATTAWVRGMGVRGGIVRGALFFAIVHVLTVSGSGFGEAAGQALVGFVGRMPVALALGWVFVQRRSLYASIGLHGAFNAILLVASELIGA